MGKILYVAANLTVNTNKDKEKEKKIEERRKLLKLNSKKDGGNK